MSRGHHVVVVHGLGDGNSIFNKIISSWTRFRVIPHFYEVNWRNDEAFAPKLEKLIDYVDKLKKDDSVVSLIGISAGGSAILNAFCARQKSIHRAVNICGRLRAGEGVTPSLEWASKSSRSFKESVEVFEKQEPKLSGKARQKIMTIRAIFDEIVPTSTISLNGAKNVQIASIEHIISISFALLFYIDPIMKFIKEDAE